MPDNRSNAQFTGLLPCPFCGETASASRFDEDELCEWDVMCGNGACPSDACVTKAEKDDAIAAWNTRASNPWRDFREQYLRLREKYDELRSKLAEAGAVVQFTRAENARLRELLGVEHGEASVAGVAATIDRLRGEIASLNEIIETRGRP